MTKREKLLKEAEKFKASMQEDPSFYKRFNSRIADSLFLNYSSARFKHVYRSLLGESIRRSK